MKSCSNCGSENPELKVLEVSVLDRNDFQNALSFEDGFSRPDWKVISRCIERLPPENQEQAWSEAGFLWLTQLRDDLGGDYRLKQSAHIFFLSTLEDDDSRRVLEFSERAILTIRELLGDAIWTGWYGKHVVLLFTEEDDYYQYLAPFLRDGINVRTGGVLLDGGYVHIALNSESFIRPTLAHELTHNYLVHLPLPLWLNEGVAMLVQRYMAEPNSSHPFLDRELAEQHRNYWTESNIQDFWAGTSFGTPGDAQTLSYSLAEIIVQGFAKDRDVFNEFLLQAHYMDGGQTAALNCLGANLGDVISSFLGPGNWRPYRKALVECWNRMGPA